MSGAIHRLHGEALDSGLALAQVLHLAVVDVVGPGTGLGDGEAAQCTRARGAVARHKLVLTLIRIADGQHADVAQLATHHVQIFEC
nr:hypothetical protein [Aeromonas jandaei]